MIDMGKCVTRGQVVVVPRFAVAPTPSAIILSLVVRTSAFEVRGSSLAKTQSLQDARLRVGKRESREELPAFGPCRCFATGRFSIATCFLVAPLLNK
jgi:hypothetical protein